MEWKQKICPSFHTSIKIGVKPVLRPDNIIYWIIKKISHQCIWDKGKIDNFVFS